MTTIYYFDVYLLPRLPFQHQAQHAWLVITPTGTHTHMQHSFKEKYGNIMEIKQLREQL